MRTGSAHSGARAHWRTGSRAHGFRWRRQLKNSLDASLLLRQLTPQQWMRGTPRGEVAMAYEIRPMSVGEILDTGFRLLRNHFSLLVAISAIAYVPMGILQFGLALVGRGADPEQSTAMLVPILIVV